MLTLKQLRDDKEAAVRRLAKKGVDARPVIDRIEQLDDRRKAIQQELDNCLSQQNQAAKMIGALMGQGKRDEAEAKKAEVAALKEKSVKLSAEMKQTADALQAEIVRPGRKTHRSGISRLQGQGSPPATCADQLLPRLQHPRGLPGG